MKKRDWTLFFVALVIAAAAFATWAISQSIQPEILTPPERPIETVASCGYEEAHRKADEARNARDQQPKTATKEAVAKATDEAKAAEHKEAEAKECEERAHTAADLEAQWASAVAAQNSTNVANSFYRWASWELFIVALALGAAGWSAYETRKANRIARDIGEAQMRPYPIVAEGSSITLIFGEEPWIKAEVSVPLVNGGESPLFEVGCLIEVFFWQGAMAYPSDGNRLIMAGESVAHVIKGDTPHVVNYKPMFGIDPREYRKAIEHGSADQAMMNASVAMRVSINARDYAGRPIPTYSVWLKMAGEDIPEYLPEPTPGRRVMISRSFEPPRRSLNYFDHIPKQTPVERFHTWQVDLSEDKGPPPFWKRWILRGKKKRA